MTRVFLLAFLTLTGCAAVEKDWNSLTPAQHEQLVRAAIDGAAELCARYRVRGAVDALDAFAG